MVDLKVDLSGITLDNPVIPASGTFGYGKEFAELYDLDILGSISFKGTTAEERYGNELPRIAECSRGMLNSVGLQNPGLDTVLEHELPELAWGHLVLRVCMLWSVQSAEHCLREKICL